MERIAVLGAGGTGQSIAADLTLAGFEINLYEDPKFKEKLDPIRDRGGIVIRGAARQGFAKISMVTTDLGEALRDASIVLVAVGAIRHKDMAELCSAHLKDGQVVLIGPDNGGALLFAKVFRDKQLKKKIKLAGLVGNYYSCRRVGFAEVLVAMTSKSKRIAAFPAKDTPEVIKELGTIYSFVPGTNALEVALSSPNTVSHLADSLLNTGTIEKTVGPYRPYWDGSITPSVIKCREAVRGERAALFKALGCVDSTSESHKKLQDRLIRLSEFPELDAFRQLSGPNSMKHRYITEDGGTANTLMVSLGDMIGVPTPVTKALVIIASTMNGVDYLKEGRTVEQLGVNGLTVAELNRFLYEGTK